MKVIIAGAPTGLAAGNSVSTQVVVDALDSTFNCATLTHSVSPTPWYEEATTGSSTSIRVGVQPVAIHAEGLLPGWLHRDRLRAWTCAWAINSRYASALLAGGVPYIIWEATLLRDELAAIPLRELRTAGRGTGLGRVLHGALLPLGERFERLLYRRAARVFTMSPHTRERIVARHGMSPERVEVLLHPPTEAFIAELARQRTATHETATGPTASRILFVGRVDDPRKNFALLRGAIGILQSGGADVQLTVVGPISDAYRKCYARADAELGITYRGEVSLPELVRAYLDHAVLAIPSRQEGFGIVAAEALHAGLPVVSTRCGGPEHIVEASGGGVLVSHTSTALATALAEMLQDTQRSRQMRTRAVGYAREYLGLDRFQQTVRCATRALAAQPA